MTELPSRQRAAELATFYGGMRERFGFRAAIHPVARYALDQADEVAALARAVATGALVPAADVEAMRAALERIVDAGGYPNLMGRDSPAAAIAREALEVKP